jgi:hypothetical protein
MSCAPIHPALQMNSDRDRPRIFNPRILAPRLSFGSAVAAPYVLAIVWQYFCTFQNKSVAWTLALILSAATWILCVSLTERESAGLPRQFWIVVALPLLFFYLIRLPFPDLSFDVLNYHIFHGERALRGPLLIPGDFFPTPAPFNPTPDIVTGLYRHLFGYRLGTVVNCLALLWTGAILDRILRDWIRSPWLRSGAVFFVLATEQLLFQVNNYMVDLLALPLLLESMLVSVNASHENSLARRTIRLSLLLGAAVAFKLANLIYAVPIALVYIFNLIAATSSLDRGRTFGRLSKIVVPAALAFALPLLPFTIFIYRMTGNPVFPLYNGLFKSPYWPQGILFDPRWGPYGVLEILGWPVVMLFHPSRLSEYAFYSGRLSIGFLVAAAVILPARRNRRVRQIALITLAGALLWSASSGYIRYALFLELTSGILIIWIAIQAWNRSRKLPGWRKLFDVSALALLLFVSAPFALARAYLWEWSARPTVFDQQLDVDLNEARNLLRDRDLGAYLAPADRHLFEDVGLWIETTYKTSAIQALLKPEVPAVGVRVLEYFANPVARKKVADVLSEHRDKRMFTLTDQENYDAARNALVARGLAMGNSRPVSIYYFSTNLKFDLLLVEVVPRPAETTNDKGAAETGVPLPDNAFNAALSAINPPATLPAGQKYELRVVLKNQSEVTWPGRQPAWQFQLTVGNRWLKPNGEKVNDVDGRTALFTDLAPGGTVELPLTITAPNGPGIYIMQVDAIQEGVAWFGDRGSQVLSLNIRVE